MLQTNIAWKNVELPDTGVDGIEISKPLGFLKIILRVLGKRKKVLIPENLIGRDIIPDYVLQEFHNLPNGNYSNGFTEGYSKGFEISIPGGMDRVRKQLLVRLKSPGVCLDVGTAAGKMCKHLNKLNPKQIWGIDPSPYLLKIADKENKGVKFVQAVVEQQPFENNFFDTITACMIFHELPNKELKSSLIECNRTLKMGGEIYIAEPSEIQMTKSYLELVKEYGLNGIYFRFMANRVYEPYINYWHGLDKKKWLKDSGFEIIEFNNCAPVQYLIAKKVSNLNSN